MDLYQQGFVSLDRLEIFVLDEADRMLDMGFIHDVKKILNWLPARKQTLFFSATMPPEITDLVNSLLHDPVKVAVNPISSPVEAIRQSVYLVDKGNKTNLLAYLMETKGVKNALVFTRTKHGANKVARDLGKLGISAAAIHGNKSQTARQQALSDFKSGRIRCLVATDIAARGLDIEELSHVFNYNLPEVPETYVHRIGRTGRAGRGGEAIAFCDFSEKPLLRDIEKLLGKPIPQVDGHPYPMVNFEAPKRDKHGRIINEEDAEARLAARQTRQQRQQSAQKAEDHREIPAPQDIPPQGEAGSRKSRRRKKAAAQVQDASLPSVQPKLREEEPSLLSRPAPKRGVRAGTLMDTGDSMPRTDFYHPNPLDSDVIMDATARLLAPRRPSAPVRAADRTEHGQERRGSRRRGKRKSAAEHAQDPLPQLQLEPLPVKNEEKSQGRGTSKHKKAAKSARPASPSKGERSAPAPQQKKRGEGKHSRRDRPRGMPPEPRRSQTKDSTEQPSLMKPYYLDIGR